MIDEWLKPDRLFAGRDIRLDNRGAQCAFHRWARVGVAHVVDHIGVHGVLDHCVAIAASLIAGVLWGVLFGLLFKRPTAAKGMLFGLLPTLLFWFVVAPLTGQAPFAPGHRAGLLLPLLFNSIIWGGILGAFRVGPDGRADVELPIPVTPSRYRYFDISLQEDNGDPAHSGNSVLRGATSS